MPCSANDLLYVGNDNFIELLGLNNPATGLYVNDATVAFRLYELDGVTAVSTSITLSYVAASNGNYRGTLEDTVAMVVDKQYLGVYTATGAGLQGRWDKFFTAVRRRD